MIATAIIAVLVLLLILAVGAAMAFRAQLHTSIAQTEAAQALNRRLMTESVRQAISSKLE